MLFTPVNMNSSRHRWIDHREFAVTGSASGLRHGVQRFDPATNGMSASDNVSRGNRFEDPDAV